MLHLSLLRFPLGRSHMQLPRILAVLGGSIHVTSRRRLSHDGFPHMRGVCAIRPCTVWHDSGPGWIGTVSMSSSCTPSIRLYCQDREAGLVRNLAGFALSPITDGLEPRLLVRARLNAKSCEPLGQHRERC